MADLSNRHSRGSRNSAANTPMPMGPEQGVEHIDDAPAQDDVGAFASLPGVSSERQAVLDTYYDWACLTVELGGVLAGLSRLMHLVRQDRSGKSLSPRLGGAAAEMRSEQPIEQLAHRAAGVLHQGIDRLAGHRKLGALANAYNYIARLENEADALFRSQVAILLRRDATDVESIPWTEGTARKVRILVALESLTDRCEDIADALVLMECVLSKRPQELQRRRFPSSALPTNTRR